MGIDAEEQGATDIFAGAILANRLADGEDMPLIETVLFGAATVAGSAEDDPVAGLDVSLLQDRFLAPVLGIDDPRTNSRIDFIGGIRGTIELESRVDSGAAAVAFAMVPTTVAQLMAISDAGEIMPPKSTWFEPKLRDGLFCHDI